MLFDDVVAVTHNLVVGAGKLGELLRPELHELLAVVVSFLLLADKIILPGNYPKAHSYF